jgi:N-carbamoyl-L-amino-acid hydrolase
MTAHPLEVAIFANEEGQNYGPLCGSRALVGDIEEESLHLTSEDGRTMGEAIRFIGGDPDNIRSSIRSAEDVHAFLELHIEQGGQLEMLGFSIGSVEGISGIQYVDVHVRGAPNHAGTTAMEMRRDALVAASRLVLAVNKVASKEHLCRVATVGSATISPNSANIIPGAVDLIVEMRDLQQERLGQTLEHLRWEAGNIARETGVTFEFKARKLIPPVPADPTVLAAVERSSRALGLACHRMPSGAGHDAQIIARIAPMGMIFVPSIGGVSHSPEEFTKAEDCTRGADVLLRAILQLDAIEQLV